MQVMELMRGGELFDYVVEKGTLSEEEVCVDAFVFGMPTPILNSHDPRPTPHANANAPQQQASDLVRRLASAIAYMHSMEIIHRDLKPGA